MNEKVTQFPLPPSRRISFRIGDRVHVLVIPVVLPGLQPKRAAVIPISITSDKAGPPTGKAG